jgi:predicted transcriptional regulator
MSSILTDTAERLNEMLNSKGISLSTRDTIIAVMMSCIGVMVSMYIAKNRGKINMIEIDETVQETDGTDIMSVQTALLSAVRTVLNIYANTSS